MDKVINVDGVGYHFRGDQKSVTVSLSKDRVVTPSLEKITEISKTQNQYLLTGSVAETEDAYTWTYSVPDGLHYVVDIEKLMTRADKLLLLTNLFRLQSVIDSRVNFFIHPDNVLFDAAYNPVLIHRGFEGVVPPVTMDHERTLAQFQSFVIYLLDARANFEQLYEGGLANVKSTKFNQEVQSASTLDELHDVLAQAYQDEYEHQQAVTTVVPKREARFHRIGFYIASVLAVIFIGATLYLTLIKVPYEERLLDGQKDFLAADYDAVITDLKGENPDKLPKASQYILATSYVNTDDLSATQKKNVLRNVTLKSDSDYLSYWINIGQGQFKKALSVAQYINDDQLVLYAYTKLYDQVNADPNLSGQQKQSDRAKYQKQIDKYTKKLGGVKNGLSK